MKRGKIAQLWGNGVCDWVSRSDLVRNVKLLLGRKPQIHPWSIALTLKRSVNHPASGFNGDFNANPDENRNRRKKSGVRRSPWTTDYQTPFGRFSMPELITSYEGRIAYRDRT
ncbi:hypothetical protein K0M31_014509, partial [Melipona bicolor]